MVLAQLITRAGRSALFFAPAAWIATEYLRGFLFGGFPWVPLGNSQVTVLAVAQVASVLGVYGLSALVAFVNASIAFALFSTGRSRLIAIVSTVVVLVGIAAWGSWRVADGSLTRDGTPIRVGLIQGNVAQEDKMAPTPQTARRIFTSYLAMTRDAVRRGAEYVIWPESSTPFTFGHDAAGEAALRDLAREVGVPILFGSDQIVAEPELRQVQRGVSSGPGRGHGGGVSQDSPRALWRVLPVAGVADVRRAARQALPAVHAGDEVVMLPVAGHPTSTAICYEVVFPLAHA